MVELPFSPHVFILSNYDIDEEELSHNRTRYICIKTGIITDADKNIRDENDNIIKKYEDIIDTVRNDKFNVPIEEQIINNIEKKYEEGYQEILEAEKEMLELDNEDLKEENEKLKKEIKRLRNLEQQSNASDDEIEELVEKIV